MSFTDRFLKVPTKRHSPDENLYGLKLPMLDSFQNIDPWDISSYKPSSDYKNATSIYFKNGRDILAFLSVTEFEAFLNEWEKKQGNTWSKN